MPASLSRAQFYGVYFFHSKNTKLDVTNCDLGAQNDVEYVCGRGSALDPTGELMASLKSSSCIKGPTCKERKRGEKKQKK